MNTAVKNIDLPAKIFTVNNQDFTAVTLEVFRFQHAHNRVYRQYCDILKTDPEKVNRIGQVPFLPISFFKTHQVVTTEFVAEAVFESSGTTQTINSRHFIKDLAIYQRSFTETFQLFYGDPAGWCIIALLPSYLERNNSSLVMMAGRLIQQSGHPLSGFYLNESKKLQDTLLQLETEKQQTLLIGVTFALLDLAGQYPLALRSTTIMETGGMKGRRTEITRQEVQAILADSFRVKHIHSEYGMTELLSQAYSTQDGLFRCPPWMKILVREEDDPLAIHEAGAGNIRGAINVIDLANIYSCSFIATEDAGKLYADGSFEVLGRLDNTDIRGCSLLSL